ncbi:MAG: M23 family metallopeptidase [Bacteroidia bacterium]|nr:M23 family metallopeptidase [Bacteroidia bacterium]NND25482.1 M23 family metallopeptidase [Flavobacteriaceae bacterium]MBT8277629.1 M23 family metallopeptidase [Bacteroidia bacterium]NNK60564.1 M23 family metallopeptidase [Flavobacteriaceae bacterium]NNL31943.1 M23 family metallopeptidase [Flavobacteriaceae bacterium]
MKHINLIFLLFTVLLFQTCKDDVNIETAPDLSQIINEEKELYEFGYNLNNFTVIRDTIKRGDTFGIILERNNISYPKIYEIAEKAKDTFDIRKLQLGKPYTLLCTKDELKEPQAFIYQPNKLEYVVIEFCDSILAYKEKKPIKIVEKVASGIINDNPSVTMEEQGLPIQLAYDMSDIYAWTIDFFRLQKGDRFKLIYKQRFIEDSIYAGIESIDAAFFEHRGEAFYAFKYVVDSTKNIADYFDEETKSLRRTFLKAPVQFSRISSRYNLNRRIAYYGYKRRPHKGTDFAAPVGTEILATANGTVTESTRRGGNGKYVKIKHNGTYSTQYLHMSRRSVNVGDYVKQGDVIGYVGMTGNTGGPHVCYRFWKNGKQVDPFREKLPAAESIPDSLLTDYSQFIIPIKTKLDGIDYVQPTPIIPEVIEDIKPQNQ